jgi:hypothetical protein
MALITLQRSSPFYPLFGIASMHDRQGNRWRELVEWTTQLPGIDGGRHQSHAGEHHDPFCALCAGEALARFKGSEDDLLKLYYRNLYDINQALTTMRLRKREQVTASAAAIA